jgi:hypothetical protein
MDVVLRREKAGQLEDHACSVVAPLARNGETAPFGAGKFESGIGAPALMARIANDQSVECAAPR